MPITHSSNTYKSHQKRVSLLICEGYESKQIAAELGLTVGVTRIIIQLLKAKHCAVNIAHLAAIITEKNMNNAKGNI